MLENQLLKVNTAIFGFIAIVHSIRVLNDWNVIVADVTIPLWVSCLLVLLGAYLAYQNWQRAR